jgi:hypothetical protein
VTRHTLARLGFAATAVLYAVIGATAARVALRGARDPAEGIPGALRWLLAQRHGGLLLGSVAAGLAAFAVWHLLEARRRNASWFERAGHLLGAAGYLGLTGTAVSLLLRSRKSSEGFSKPILAWLLARPAGVLLVEAAGAATLAAGLAEVWQGASGRLRQRFATRWLAPGAAGFVRRAARFGLASRGVVLIVIGVVQIRVARHLASARMMEIGGALRALSKSATVGPILAALVALGLIAYGFYMAVLAVAARRS